MNKAKVKLIEITRVEGPIELCDITKTFTNFNSANAWLLSQSHTFPSKGHGYDKHDFKVIWENNDYYTGRLDCMQYDCDDNDLNVRTHIRDELTYLANMRKPVHMKLEDWKYAQEEHNKNGSAEEALKMLETLEL